MAPGLFESNSLKTKEYFKKVVKWINDQVYSNKKKVFIAICCGALQAKPKQVNEKGHPDDIIQVNTGKHISDEKLSRDLIETLEFYRTCQYQIDNGLIPSPFVGVKHVDLHSKPVASECKCYKTN